MASGGLLLRQNRFSSIALPFHRAALCCAIPGSIVGTTQQCSSAHKETP